ncbi:MAG: HAD hydrolase family protein [Chitinivibrionia bacterium]|nr:HAD hydrolase family protein [Chitinivibrionia bacterium]
MLTIEIPGYKTLQLDYLVLDYNGTLAVDGVPIPGVAERLREIARTLDIHVLTADTFGMAKRETGSWPVALSILGEENQDERKAGVVAKLGAQRCAAIGNGRNDRLMLETAELGIAVIQAEGAARHAVSAADLVFNNINDALDALLNPRRLIASLRR